MRSKDRFFVCAESNVGKKRKNNEDNFLCNDFYRQEVTQDILKFEGTFSKKDLNIIAVFDGMGGEKRGELASYIAARTLSENWENSRTKNEWIDGTEAIFEMNRQVCKENAKYSGRMGSTAVLMVVKDYQLQIFNVGDSRAYLFRKNRLRQLSVDHTEGAVIEKVQEPADNTDTVVKRKKSNVLTQCLGVEEEEFLLEPHETERIIMQEGDIFLFCSDGLTGELSDEEITQILLQEKSIAQKKEALIQAALQAGGRDNVTAVLVEI